MKCQISIIFIKNVTFYLLHPILDTKHMEWAYNRDSQTCFSMPFLPKIETQSKTTTTKKEQELKILKQNLQLNFKIRAKTYTILSIYTLYISNKNLNNYIN